MEEPENYYIHALLKIDEVQNQMKQFLKDAKYEELAVKRDTLYTLKGELKDRVNLYNHILQIDDLNEQNFNFIHSITKVLGGQIYANVLMRNKIKESKKRYLRLTELENGLKNQALLDFLNKKEKQFQ